MAADCVYVLVGTKNDLDRKIDYDDGVAFMKKHNLDLFFETSAKTGHQIAKVFEESAKEIIGKALKKSALANEKTKLESQKLKLNEPQKKEKKKCC